MKLLFFIVPIFFMGNTTSDLKTIPTNPTIEKEKFDGCSLDETLLDATEIGSILSPDEILSLDDISKFDIQDYKSYMSRGFCNDCIVVVVNCPCVSFSAQYCYDCPLFPSSIGEYKAQLCASACNEN